MESTPTITVTRAPSDVSDEALRSDAMSAAEAVKIAETALSPSGSDTQQGIATLAAGILIASAIRGRRVP